MGNTTEKDSYFNFSVCDCGKDRYDKGGFPSQKMLKKFKTLDLIEINQPWFVEVDIGEN